MRRLSALLLALTGWVLLVTPGRAMADERGWEILASGGHAVLIRHALAPGTGDPADFALHDCSTQRNLSAEGREQARRLGEQFRERGIAVDAVLSSQWCRSLETARLAFPGHEVVEEPAFNSFFADRSRSGAQNVEATKVIRSHGGKGNLVVVTHQVNITALTGITPRQGEAVVVVPEGDGLRVLARIVTQ